MVKYNFNDFRSNKGVWEYWGLSLIKFDSCVSLNVLEDISVTALWFQ